MIADPVSVAGLVVREVRTGSRDGTPTRVVVARRGYRGEPGDVWNALTDPERIPRWFLPVSGELRVGGRYRFEGNAGGLVQECRAPETFAVTWEMGPVVSWLRVTLTPEDGGTLLELLHEAPVDPELWERFGPSAVGLGWDLGLLGLGLHLDSGEAVDPALAAGLLTSAEGVEFVRTAAEGWASAAAADGDETTAAREAAERTVAAYTAAPGDDVPGNGTAG